MTVIIKKVFAEKKQPIRSKIDVKSNLKIVNIEKINDENARIEFNYLVEYTPDYGNLEISGEMIYTADKEEIKNLVKEWESKKKINDKIAITIFNRILVKCNIEAVIISKEVNLPPPFNLPKFVKK